MKLRFVLLYIIIILLPGFIVIYYNSTNRSEGKSPLLTTRSNLRLVRRAILAYKLEEGNWPDYVPPREELLKFSKKYFMGLEDESVFYDGWNNPIKYKITVDDSGNETVIVYSMGKNSIDDKGNIDDLVEKIENDKLVD